MSTAAISQRVVLVAVFLVIGTRSAAAWQAMPGLPAATPDPPGRRSSDTEGTGDRAKLATAVAPPPVIVRPSPAEGPPPEDRSRAAAQFFLGALTMMGAGGAAILLGAATGEAAPGIVVGLAGPGVGGYVVCALGRASDTYDGGCAPAMAGAYLGALTAIPLGFLGFALCSPASNNGNDEGTGAQCIGSVLFGVATGYVMGTALGATIGWHLGKHRRGAGAAPVARPPEVPAAPAGDWSELRRRPAGSTPGATRLVLPLVAFSF